MKQPLISVIIPSYNSSRTLYSCLKSIFESDYKNFEVIVVDDKSTDNSVEIAEKFPCRVIKKNTNTGAGDSRNIGANNAKHEILFFTDTDCILKENTLKEIANSFDKNVNIVAGTYSNTIFNKQNIFSAYQQLFCFYNYLNSSEPLFGTQCCAIRKKTFFELGYFDNSIKSASVEDLKLQFQIVSSKYKYCVNMNAQVYHDSRNSFTNLIRHYYMRSKHLVMLALRFKKMPHKNGYIVNYNNLLLYSFICISASSLILMFFYPIFIVTFFASILFFIYFKRKFYQLFANKRFEVVCLSFICDATIVIGALVGTFKYLNNSDYN